MNTEEPDDELFSELLRKIARTPDVSGLRRTIGPGSELLNRFVIGRQLGEGGMGRVFVAFDRARQAHVAIKLLGMLTPHSIAALKREFRIAERLSHPNLVRLHELFNDGEEWFFTMDLLEGATVRRAFAQGVRGDLGLVRHVFRQLAEALSELHRMGTLHGDLKPSNFLLVGAEMRVLLLDFGVSRPLGVGPALYSCGGTREYAAPEQRDDIEVGAAADWYSFGVVLFEVLTGRLPKGGAIESQLSGVPAELAELCCALLQESAELRPDGRAVRRALGETASTPLFALRPEAGVGHELVGRIHEREQLMVAYEWAARGKPQVVLVRGASGIGKTALLEHFTKEVQRRGGTVLSSHCRERESTSYKAIDGLIDDLVEYLERLPPQDAARILPDGIADLTRLFPTLRTAVAVAAHSARGFLDGSDQSVVKRNAIAAFTQLLLTISARSPLVVCIDDLQWSDPDSAALLQPVLSCSGPAKVLLVGSCRSPNGTHGPTIDILYGQGSRVLPEPLLVELAPLAPSDAEALARELLPKAANRVAVARNIAMEAAGSPLFIAELVHQRGAAEGDSSTSRPLRSLNQLIGLRVAALPEDARGLLEATALAGLPLSYAAARRCRGLTPNRTEQVIDLLRVNRLARMHGAGEDRSIEMHHDRIREIVLQGLPPVLRTEHHLRLARALSTDPTVAPEVLAGHFYCGGEQFEAVGYWRRGADAAFAALAFGHAAELYQRAADPQHLSPQELAQVQIKRAEALAYDGKATAAAEVYLHVAESQVQERAIELRRRAAEQLLLSGHLERGLAVIALVLKGLGMRGTRTGRRVLCSILLGRLLVRLRGLRFTLRSEAALSERELSRVDASWSIACSLGVVDFLRGVDFQNDHLLLALKAGEPRRLLRAMTLEISYTAGPGRGSPQRTAQLLKISEVLAQKVDDPAAAGLVSVSRGVAAYLHGRFAEALLECQAAVTGMRRYSGMIWETVTAQRFIVASLFHLGRLKTLSQLVPPLLAEAEAKGNLYASVFFRTTYANSAWLLHDDVGTAREQLSIAATEWRAQGTQLPHCWLLVGHANFAFYSGDHEQLWSRIEREWPRFVSAQFLRVGMLRVQLWQLRAWAALAQARAHFRAGRVRQAQRFNQEGRRCAKLLDKQPLEFAKPLAALALAAADRQSGDLTQARIRLARCVEVFSSLDMKLYAATASTRLGELLGGDEGAQLVAKGRSAFSAEGVIGVARMLNMLSPDCTD